jgi:hypothetical protein
MKACYIKRANRKDLCRVRNRVSVEILFHVASPSQGAQVVYRSRLRELPRALCT